MSCIICGQGFETLSCVTFEHITPVAMGGSMAWRNIAPSHYTCNTRRGTRSIIEAARKSEVFRARLGEKAFNAWCSKPIPNCDMPAIARIDLSKVRLRIPEAWTGSD